jgi:hypothetical protein
MGSFPGRGRASAASLKTLDLISFAAELAKFQEARATSSTAIANRQQFPIGVKPGGTPRKHWPVIFLLLPTAIPLLFSPRAAARRSARAGGWGEPAAAPARRMAALLFRGRRVPNTLRPGLPIMASYEYFSTSPPAWYSWAERLLGLLEDGLARRHCQSRRTVDGKQDAREGRRSIAALCSQLIGRR